MNTDRILPVNKEHLLLMQVLCWLGPGIKILITGIQSLLQTHSTHPERVWWLCLIAVAVAVAVGFSLMFNNFITKLRTTEAQEAKISTASPINLMVHVNDSQRDSIAIVTPFATFPFTFDFWVLGNTNRPLLRGDVTNSNAGFIGVQDLYEFELNSFSISSFAAYSTAM